MPPHCGAAGSLQICPMLMRSPVPAWRRRVPPGFIPPCQPLLAERVPSGDGWLHELKHDGFRIIARKEGDHVRLWSSECSSRVCIRRTRRDLARCEPANRIVLGALGQKDQGGKGNKQETTAHRQVRHLGNVQLPPRSVHKLTWMMARAWTNHG